MSALLASGGDRLEEALQAKGLLVEGAGAAQGVDVLARRGLHAVEVEHGVEALDGGRRERAPRAAVGVDDPQGPPRVALLETVLEVMRDPQRTILLSSHDLADVHRLSDRLTVLSGGAVLADGATGELVPEGKTLADVLVERHWTR